MDVFENKENFGCIFGRRAVVHMYVLCLFKYNKCVCVCPSTPFLTHVSKDMKIQGIHVDPIHNSTLNIGRELENGL